MFSAFSGYLLECFPLSLPSRGAIARRTRTTPNAKFCLWVHLANLGGRILGGRRLPGPPSVIEKTSREDQKRGIWSGKHTEPRPQPAHAHAAPNRETTPTFQPRNTQPEHTQSRAHPAHSTPSPCTPSPSTPSPEHTHSRAHPLQSTPSPGHTQPRAHPLQSTSVFPCLGF